MLYIINQLSASRGISSFVANQNQNSNVELLSLMSREIRRSGKRANEDRDIKETLSTVKV